MKHLPDMFTKLFPVYNSLQNIFFHRCAFGNRDNSIHWAVYIVSLSVSGNVQDVAVDSTTGDIIYIVGNTLYKMVAGGQTSSVKQEFMNLHSCTVDATNRQVLNNSVFS